MNMEKADWFDVQRIDAALQETQAVSKEQVAAIVAKALEFKGLTFAEVAVLCRIESDEMLAPVLAAAQKVKEAIYGRRIVLFAPLYISNLCKNECLYCAFRASNNLLTRKALSMEEIQRDTRVILDQGHKRVLMVAGESYPKEDGFSYVIKAIEAIYATKNARGDSIRRVNANVAPLSVAQFRELKAAGIGTYQLFQETYDPRVYKNVHVGGKKSNFDWRLTGMDRAMEAGIDDVGIGALLGLGDWRFEVLAMMLHNQHLEDTFGVGCHTISVPRIEPAVGSEMAASPPKAVSDRDFMRVVAILRLAVPYTGIIMSTRETAVMRNATLKLGVSQISAGSCTDPGGYEASRNEQAAQFQLGDHRSLAEVISDIASQGYVPSFCTACYRMGRTGHDFMDLAKPGAIKSMCGPNALSTYMEFLLNYAPDALESLGKEAIAAELGKMCPQEQAIAQGLLEKVSQGEKDVLF